MPRGKRIPLFIEHEIVTLWKNRKPIKFIKHCCKVSNDGIYNTLKKYSITRNAKKAIRGQLDLFVHVGGLRRR